ncbi:MAG: glycoside hydrolase family 127 protein [Sedimentisphaerales bacterium]|nr:glycoside hydrolase family 127 protein [Sedimentisphaerales bacterium]
METDRAYLLRLDPDRLLAGFPREAGLPKKADPYGGWETIPDEGRYSLAGQALGHYLSALSMLTAATETPRPASESIPSSTSWLPARRPPGPESSAPFPTARRFLRNSRPARSSPTTCSVSTAAMSPCTSLTRSWQACVMPGCFSPTGRRAKSWYAWPIGCKP